MTQRDSLTSQQVKYVSMFCQGQNHSDIARTLGVARKTIICWSKLPQIQSAIAAGNAGSERGIAQAQEERYKEISKSAVSEAAELVERFLPASVKVVVSIMGKSDAKDSDKIRAAELITKWAGLGQTGNQIQQSAEQNLYLYIAALENKTDASLH